MSLLQRLLLLPLLSPLLAMLLLGAMNPRPWLALRLLTWISPAIPLGVWISGAAAAGAALSAAGTSLALRQAEPNQRERGRIRWPRGEEARWDKPSEPPPQEAPGSGWAGPSRRAGDPPPTVSVQFRVLRKGRTAASTATRSGEVTAASTGPDDWDRTSTEDW